jgi:hypothetical protein
MLKNMFFSGKWRVERGFLVEKGEGRVGMPEAQF